MMDNFKLACCSPWPDPLSRTLFKRLMEIEKNVGGRSCLPAIRRNQVGAACSAYRMVENEPTHGAETCPLSAITLPFSPLPKNVSGRELGGPSSRRDLSAREE